jgi:hypothetical protein
MITFDLFEFAAVTVRSMRRRMERAGKPAASSRRAASHHPRISA